MEQLASDESGDEFSGNEFELSDNEELERSGPDRVTVEDHAQESHEVNPLADTT
jgi:hypothetical protein